MFFRVSLRWSVNVSVSYLSVNGEIFQSRHVCCLYSIPDTLCLSLTLSFLLQIKEQVTATAVHWGGFVNSLCSLCFGLMKTNEYIKPPQRRRRDWNTERDETTHLTMQKPPSLRPVLHKTCYLTCMEYYCQGHDVLPAKFFFILGGKKYTMKKIKKI